MLIKVCGMREPANIKDLVNLPIDLIGLIFYQGSPRYVEASIDLSIFPERVKKVGVFVNENLKGILKATETYKLNVLQLHGNESPEFIEKIKNNLPGIAIFKAFSVRDELPAFAEFEGLCDAYLFDTAGKSAGGNGIRFNWGILNGYDGQTPFLLSGGIAPDIAPELLNFEHPKWIGIDINSKFENSPAVKNIPLIIEFLKRLANKMR